MTLAQLRTDVTNEIGEHPEVDYVKLFNSGVKKMALLSKRVTTIPLSISNGAVILPDDCLIVKSVYYDDVPLDRYAGDVVPNYSGQFPLYWSKSGTEVSLTPAPSSGTVNVAYISKGVDMADDGDEPGIEGLDDLLVAYGCYRILLRAEGYTPLTQQWEKEYLQEREDWLRLDSNSEKRPYVGKRPSYK